MLINLGRLGVFSSFKIYPVSPTGYNFLRNQQNNGYLLNSTGGRILTKGA